MCTWKQQTLLATLYHRRFASVLPTEECGGEITCIISDDRQSRGTQAMGVTVHTVNSDVKVPINYKYHMNTVEPTPLK